MSHDAHFFLPPTPSQETQGPPADLPALHDALATLLGARALLVLAVVLLVAYPPSQLRSHSCCDSGMRQICSRSQSSRGSRSDEHGAMSSHVSVAPREHAVWRSSGRCWHRAPPAPSYFRFAPPHRRDAGCAARSGQSYTSSSSSSASAHAASSAFATAQLPDDDEILHRRYSCNTTDASPSMCKIHVHMLGLQRAGFVYLALALSCGPMPRFLQGVLVPVSALPIPRLRTQANERASEDNDAPLPHTLRDAQWQLHARLCFGRNHAGARIGPGPGPGRGWWLGPLDGTREDGEDGGEGRESIRAYVSNSDSVRHGYIREFLASTSSSCLHPLLLRHTRYTQEEEELLLLPLLLLRRRRALALHTPRAPAAVGEVSAKSMCLLLRVEAHGEGGDIYDLDL
ncbi:hypothetical protein B0H11DRAFT_2270699 [Mycena galericulata]|nr:hypothetical protein B0H11DRAFT_2270699 [Mycena galericulata]